MPVNNWRLFAQRTNALEKVYQPKIKRLVLSVRDKFIREYKANPNNAVSNLQQLPISEDLGKIITAIYGKAGLMGAKMTADEIKKAAKQKAGGFGRNEMWIREVRNYLKLHLLEFVADITDTMRNDIIKILEMGVEEGWGIDQIVLKLRETRLIEARSRTIARTEIIRAANVGHSVGAKSLPYEVDKKWIAAKDHRTRHSHALINTHKVDENGYFEVPVYKGDKPSGVIDQMTYPGDPNASPSNTINCRCRVIYEPKRDASGRLIMRQPNQATIIPMRRPQQMPADAIAAILKANVRIGVDVK